MEWLREGKKPRPYASQEGLQNPSRWSDDKGSGVAQVGVVAGWEETTSRHYASQEGLDPESTVVVCIDVRKGNE